MSARCSALSFLSFVSCLLLAILINSVASQNPGAKIQVSQAGLNYAAQVGIDVLSTKVVGLRIPDQSGSTSVVVGRVEYSITNVFIRGFTKPSTSVIVNAGTGLTWSMSGAGVAVTGNWAYKYKLLFIKISDHGTFDLTVSGASVSLSVTLGKDSAGRPTTKVLGCSCSIAKVDVRFHGGASWIYNLFSGAVERPIKSKLQSAICDAATKTVNTNGAQQLATLKTNVRLESRFYLDYRFVENVLFASGYIQTAHKGEVFRYGDTSEAPFSARAIAMPVPPLRMVTACISEYVANTLGHVLFKNNILWYNLTRSDVPAGFRPFFATNCSTLCFGTLFPQVASLYPNSLLQLNLQITSRPTLVISEPSAAVTFTGRADVVVKLPDGTVENLISLRVSARVTLATGVRGSVATGYVITAAVINFIPTISIISSVIDVHLFSESSLNTLLMFAANSFIIPELNEVGQKGLAVPTLSYVDFVGPTINFIDGAACVSTDVAYRP